MGLLRDAVAPLAGLVIALALGLASRSLDQFAQGDQLGPGFWPRLVLAALGLTCLAKLVTEWRRARGDGPREAGSGADDSPEISRPRLAAAMLLVVLYVGATPWIGFALATAAFVVAFMWLCGSRSALALGGNAALGTAVLLYVFLKLVYLPLPKGAGAFEDLTLAIYRGLGIL
jgi:putative tricarboxylic transport membrane protein